MATTKSDYHILITGGHTTPALAVLKELETRGYQKFTWVGLKWEKEHKSSEYQSVKQHPQVKFIHFKPGKLVRSWNKGEFLSFATNLTKIPFSFVQAFFILIINRPQLILSFGGYIAMPIAVLGKFMGIKVITHEQTIVTGLANKIIGKYADKICISWEQSRKFYPPAKVIFTGNPIRPQIFNQQTDHFNFANTKPTIYITGGHQGAQVINQAVFAALPKLLAHVNILHQTGSGVNIPKQLADLNLTEAEIAGYHYQEYYYPEEIGEVFSKSMLIVSRAGANTVYEILALAKPTIFIPIPWVTQNEQQKNAEVATKIGLASIIRESELDSEILSQRILTALELIANSQDFKQQDLENTKKEARKLIPLQADKRIADLVDEFSAAAQIKKPR